MEIFNYSFMINAFIISFFIAILCASIGVFVVLKRYSMIGDTMSHASLAGISISLLNNINPIVGAFIFTFFAGGLTEYLRKYFSKYTDLILTIIYSLSVGIAITIISSGKLKINAENFLFGSILTVSKSDIYITVILSAITLILLGIFYYKMIYITLDEEMAKVLKINTNLISYIFIFLISGVVAISIRIVGVLVLGSMIAMPVATALQFKKGFKTTFILSVVFSILDIYLALFLSYYLNVAPGGFTALISVIILFVVIIMRYIYNKLLKKQVN